jgi:uncharacterized protein
VSSKVFRDPVHGDMEFARELEMALVDTPEFQRLRGIKQLGAANLVYPSAVHSRFEHSLGTSWLARRMLAEIGRWQPLDLSLEEQRALSAAALLHDVSHIPFGHTFEDERRIFCRHDEPQRFAQFLRKGKLGAALARLDLMEPVCQVLTGASSRGEQARLHPLLRDLVSGTVCADLLDYLARDTYFCGLAGSYDQRLLRWLRYDERGLYLEAQKDGIVRHDVLSEIINLLRLRYFLSERVYYHHTKTAAGAMISRAVETAVEHGLTLDTLNQLTDDGLMLLLEHRYGRHKVVARLLDSLRSHGIYKRAYVLTRRAGQEHQQALVATYHVDREAREAAEQALTRSCRLHEGELVIYCPSASMALKEARLRVRTDHGPPRVLADLNLPEIRVLKDKHRDLWKLYVFVAPHLESRFKTIASKCEAWFGRPNELPALETGQLYLDGA